MSDAMFVNLSNHPSSQWGEAQRAAAAVYGDILDVPFPSVSPAATEEEIEKKAQELFTTVRHMQPDCVMCMGEFSLTFALVKLFLAYGIKVVSACTERNVIETRDELGRTKRVSRFAFVQFREYR